MAENSNVASRILFVCTGNICRSPLGERFLAQQLTGISHSVSITSAGTHAMTESRAPAEILAIGAAHGAPVDNHVPQLLTDDLINISDLILTAERVHRSEVVSRVPRASAKAFTIKQFARLAEEHEAFIARGELAPPTVASLSDFVAEIADFRSLASPLVSAEHDDIGDPYLLTQRDYDAVGNEIKIATHTIGSVMSKYL
jgi:protein-tyrosine phosphatase